MLLTSEQKEQGSEAWKQLRLQCVTATDIACIVGASTYLTPYELWEQKIGLKEPQKENEGMRIGKKNEEKIRQWANEKFECDFQPDVVIHPEMPFVLASLDGIDYAKEIVLEAKVVNEELFEKIVAGHVPYGFYVQIQVQLECTGFKKAYLVAYNPKLDDFSFLVITWDEKKCREFLSAASAFKFCIDNLISPSLGDEDYVTIEENDEMAQMIEQYKEARHLLTVFEDIENKLKKEIVERSGKRNTKGYGLRITKIKKKGNVDYETLFVDHEIDKSTLEKYRKPDTEYFKISEEK